MKYCCLLLKQYISDIWNNRVSSIFMLIFTTRVCKLIKSCILSNCSTSPRMPLPLKWRFLISVCLNRCNKNLQSPFRLIQPVPLADRRAGRVTHLPLFKWKRRWSCSFCRTLGKTNDHCVHVVLNVVRYDSLFKINRSLLYTLTLSMLESSVMTRDFKVQTTLRRLQMCGPVCVYVCTVFVVFKKM